MATFQPGNFTGCGSEGVNFLKLNRRLLALVQKNNLPSTEQTTKTQPKQVFSVFFHCSSFLTVYLLFRCRLWFDKGDFTEICIRVRINKRSFEPFCVWTVVKNAQTLAK